MRAAAREIAKRRPCTPPIAGGLLRRVLWISLSFEGDGRVTRALADMALTRLGGRQLGWNGADRPLFAPDPRKIIRADRSGSRRCSGKRLCLKSARRGWKEVIEPFLLQQGLDSQRTRGAGLLAAEAWYAIWGWPAQAGAICLAEGRGCLRARI